MRTSLLEKSKCELPREFDGDAWWTMLDRETKINSGFVLLSNLILSFTPVINNLSHCLVVENI